MRIRGERLRELRKRLGLTQTQVADEVGCSRGAVATWETKGRLPRPARLVALAHLLRVEVSELVDTGSPVSLRDLRVAAGLQQADVARALHVTASTYCDVEKGRQKVPRRWLPVLAFLLDVPKEDIPLRPPTSETTPGGDTEN